MSNINVYAGGAPSKSAKTARVSSADERAKATTAALSGPGAASDSGSTAVKSGGILGKIGSFVGKAAGVLGNILPGPAGAIAKAIGNITSSNDPEWWLHVPGDGLTVNAPLALVSEGQKNGAELTVLRSAFLLFDSSTGVQYPSDPEERIRVIVPTERMATQYLMPAVRKVANAIAMQDAEAYSRVFAAQVTMYALWRQLKKWDYFIKHGYPFIPNLNDPAFPLLQVSNSAWLQSTISRLEEYLHSHVRLPHTMCEYVTWRFGKLFRTNNSAKAGFVSYDVIPLIEQIDTYNDLINEIQNFISSDGALQKAAADLYNAYLSHDQEVLVSDATMMSYDSKEFVLRTNLDLLHSNQHSPWSYVEDNPIIMDSNLDNPTVFMASTISTTSEHGITPLFPVHQAFAVVASNKASRTYVNPLIPTDGTTGMAQGSGLNPVNASSLWMSMVIDPEMIGSTATAGHSDPARAADALFKSALCKAVDFYNVGIFLECKTSDGAAWVDLTSLSIDMGSVPDLVIANEQVLAFANLTSEDNTHADTYRQVEKRAAKDVANFVENTEVAAFSR